MFVHSFIYLSIIYLFIYLFIFLFINLFLICLIKFRQTHIIYASSETVSRRCSVRKLFQKQVTRKHLRWTCSLPPLVSVDWAVCSSEGLFSLFLFCCCCYSCLVLLCFVFLFFSFLSALLSALSNHLIWLKVYAESLNILYRLNVPNV